MWRFADLKSIFFPESGSRKTPAPPSTDVEEGVGEEWFDPTSPGVRIETHPFGCCTEVGIYPAHEVGVERGLGREPMLAPVRTVVIYEDGELEVWGLEPGRYCAAGQVGDRYRYVQFSVV